MLHTETTDADVVMTEENVAAAALVDVAAGLIAKRASDSPTATAAQPPALLPTNSASRKQWDQEQAAPPANDGGAVSPTAATLFPPPPDATAATATATGTNVAAATAAVTADAAMSHGFVAAATQQQQGNHASQQPAGIPKEGQWGAPPTHSPLTHAPANARPHSLSSTPSVLLSMSSLGFGVDPACSLRSGDATAAAKCAVRDAMERSGVRLPTEVALRKSLSIQLKIGVPARPSSTGEQPMHVDTTQLVSLLPQYIHLLPVELVVGGLLIDNSQQQQPGSPAIQHPTICTAVACITLQQSSVTGAAVESSIQQHHVIEVGASSIPAGTAWGHTHAHTNTSQRQHQTTSSSKFHSQLPISSHPFAPNGSTATTAPPVNIRASPTSINRNNKPPSHVHVHRTNSMEMLALVSGEIRERHMNAATQGGAVAASVASAAGVLTQALSPASAALAMVCSTESASLSQQQQQQADMNMMMANNNAYSYKKLAPGMTPKNNKRLFVKHSYKDYSLDEPMPDEQFLVRTQDSSNRTPNAAFPLKLHETLTQIEQDGYGHIIGWLPHGRSFKIHQQQEFVSVILPKYFVMTKKSSFLRQLNLYNFNRLTGPDSGSYYHEKFLRGLKWLCRRMTRQKINGNGIRAAGNPDEEPILSRFPTCPRTLASASCSSSVSHAENESHDGEGRSLARLVTVAPRPVGQSSQPLVTSSGKESILVTDENASQGSGGSGSGSPRRLSKIARADFSTSAPVVTQASFPLKLQRILDKADATGNRGIISWCEHGRAFLVHDAERFVSEVVSKYFSQTKYSSFQRQLHMYNFKRITGLGRDKGAYHHPSFERGNPDLCLSMVRTRVNGKGCRRPGDPDNEPDFYEMKHAPIVVLGSVVEIPTESPTRLTMNTDEDSEMQEGSGDEA